MDDFYVFMKNDRNLFLKQLHFIISLISFLFAISTNTLDSVIVVLAIPGTVLNSALLLGLYFLDERHDITDIEILLAYGILNLLAVVVFVNKILQMDISIFRMLFMNSYTINILLCLCSGLLMVGEGIHRLIVLLVRNIYNNSQGSKHLNVLFSGIEQNSSTIQKTNRTDVDIATSTNPSVETCKALPEIVLSYTEKDTNTSLPAASIRSTMDEYTECSHYRLNSEDDKHLKVDRHNSGDNGHIAEAGFTETHRHSGDGIHCNTSNVVHEKPGPRPPVLSYFYPKSFVTKQCPRHPKNLSGPSSSGLNETGLPVFVDRYGKRYIASLAGPAESHRCSMLSACHGYDTNSGNCKKKSSMPIDEYYTNRKYSNSKLTLIPSKDEVIANDELRVESKLTHDNDMTNINRSKINTNTNVNNNNVNNINNNSSRVASNEQAQQASKTKDKSSNEFIANYNNYLAHLYKNNNANGGKKLFNYKFYNRNYDYQWVCEA